jgi:hypothetical protein
MSNPAAFSGDYTDLRFIKTRSVCQVVIEFDISQASSFVAAFGTPMPGTGVPVAVARIQPSAVRQQLEASVALIDKPKERRSWSQLSYAEQAGIRCGEPDFWRFLSREVQEDPVTNADEAAEAVRDHCGVESRAHIKQHTEAGYMWEGLNSTYDEWLRRPF